MKIITRIAIILAVAAVMLSSCSTRKNTAMSRNYQAFITRYNVYFNGIDHYRNTLKEMEKSYQDEYSQRLYMHPAEAYGNEKATKPSGSFDRSIEKAQKAIQLHSIKKKPAKKAGKSRDPEYKEWMKREEYNPFIHNAWMLMGRSQYFKGDFSGAASTFNYVTKHFKWLTTTTTEAKLWEARCYCAMDWLFEAETILKRIKPQADLTDKTLQGLYYFTYADYYVRSNQYKQAIPMLEKAIKYAKGAQKTRLNFLLGQLCAAEGMKKEAYNAFKAAAHGSGADYRTQFNARIKQSEVFEGKNIETEVKALKRMARYSRNKEYLDQIYYAIGNLYMSQRDTTKAIENYKIAVEKSTRSGIDKALAQITLGQLYFDRHDYTDAQPCYSEAVPLLPDNYPNYSLLKRRSDVLDELALYAGNVNLQDSLLKLAAMTPEQQREVVDKIIAELKKKEKEEAEAARREAYLAEQDAKGNSMINNNNNAPSSFTINNDDSWYFYNDATRNAGKTEFQRRWGSRKLEDDWRRRNKTSFNAGDFSDNSDDDDDSPDSPEGGATADDSAAKGEKESPNANDPHFPEYYLKQIPKTEADILTSNNIIQEGIYNMGLILKDKLEDFPAAESEWDNLLTRYPDNTYRLDVYYNMYLMYARMGNLAEAEKWRNLILADFPDSKQGLALKDPSFLDNLKAMERVQEELYDRTFNDYMDNRNTAVHEAYRYMEEHYPMSKIMPKFMFLHALAFVTEKKPQEFNATLKELLERYPETDITPLASAYLKGMARGRSLQSSENGNMRGMIWDIHLGGDSTSTTGADAPLKLELDPKSPQLLVLLYPTDSIAPSAMLYDIARHNFATFVVRDFDLDMMQFGKLGLLIIKGFNNKEEVNHYLNLLHSDATLTLPPSVRPVIISEKDFETMLSQGRSFDEYFRATGEKTLQETHEATLPPDEYPSAEEMYTPAEDLPKDTPTPAEPSTEAPDTDETPDASPATGNNTPAPVVKENEPKPTETPKPEAPKPVAPKTVTPKPETPKPETPKPETPKPETPKPPAAPTTTPLPDYPDGSEGDDPLLD